MVVRSAKASDSLAIATVSVTAWRSAYTHILPKSHLDALSIEKRASRLVSVISQGAAYWVAESEGEVIGFVTAGKNRVPDVPADAELNAIYVLPKAHRQGVGKALLREAVVRLIDDGYRSMVVFAFRDNLQAGRFYMSLGAVPYGEDVYTLEGVDYPDQSYLWASLQDLQAKLAL